MGCRASDPRRSADGADKPDLALGLRRELASQGVRDERARLGVVVTLRSEKMCESRVPSQERGGEIDHADAGGPPVLAPGLPVAPPGIELVLEIVLPRQDDHAEAY